MRTLKISLLVFILSTTISAQEGWMIQNPPAPSHSLRSVDFIDTTTGWAIGIDPYNDYKGVIIKTTDGGMNWVEQLSGINEYLQEVRFIDFNIGYVVGENGLTYENYNSGNNWITQMSGNN
ncbi:MAG: hypothetical protein U5J96_03445 [Ignavibacteriaceae bacterium]|nr:hypothetical protein [Ignavibacteriaceae bacterium]